MRRRGDRPDLGRGRIAAQPALGAAPVDQAIAGQVEWRCRRRQGQAPQRRLAGKERQFPIPQRAPERGAIRQFVATDLPARGGHAVGGAGQAQMQPAVEQAQAGQRPRPTLQVDHRLRGIGGLQQQREFGFRHRQHTDRQVQHHAEGAERPRVQTREIVAGHVLDGLAAVADDLPAAIDGAHAEHEVPRRPGPRPSRAGKARGDSATQRAPTATARRLEAEHLSLRGQHGVELRQRCAGAGGDDQIARLVAQHAAVAGEVQRLAVDHVAIERLAGVAGGPQRPARFDGVTNGGDQRVGAIPIHAQKRSSSGCGSCP
jgi:hypothetical protein